MLPQVRILVRVWHENANPVKMASLIYQGAFIGNLSYRKIRDILRDVFLPRYVMTHPHDAWRYLKIFEETEVPFTLTRPLYYFFAARGEVFLGDFVREILYERYHSGATGVRLQDVLAFITEAEADGRIPKPWSESVRLRMARHLLAALRDFGILEGRARKRVAAPYLPALPFAFIAFLLEQERRGAAVLEHPDWRLFLLRPEMVERLFVEADRDGLLRYNAAGSIVRIDFPVEDLYAYSRFLAAQAA